MTRQFENTNKNGEQITKAILYKLQFIDSAKFAAQSLPNLAENLPEGILKFNANTSTITKNLKHM